jgi:GAF domain-containing protein
MPAPAQGQNVAAAFAELAETLASDLDIDRYLTAVCHHCVGLIGVRCAVICYHDTAHDADDPATRVASSHDTGRWLVTGSPDPSQSPLAQCMSTGELISVADVRARQDQWPWFGREAIAAGFRTVTAVPLNPQAGVSGALVLLGGATPDASGILLALALADAAGAGIALTDELRRQEASISQLQTALTTRIVIEQAKGVLAERWKVTPDEAFRTLRRYARDTQSRLPDLAASVVNGTIEIAPDKARPT